ncbi:MAG: hypothetical protein ACK55I_26495, partial [bacterium]
MECEPLRTLGVDLGEVERAFDELVDRRELDLELPRLTHVRGRCALDHAVVAEVARVERDASLAACGACG